MFLDPPYGHAADRSDCYACEDKDVAVKVYDWCKKHTDSKYRIVLAGFDGEHLDLEGMGWRVVEWYKSGFLQGGMGNVGTRGTQQRRERLWCSPACVEPETDRQSTFDFGA